MIDPEWLVRLAFFGLGMAAAFAYDRLIILPAATALRRRRSDA